MTSEPHPRGRDPGGDARPGPLPAKAAPRFRATVHGVAFCDRARTLETVRPGDPLLLIPEPPGAVIEQVWVHARGGDPIGHLPDEIGSWLAPWMRRGGSARARTLKVGDATVPSWRRLLVEVSCG